MVRRILDGCSMIKTIQYLGYHHNDACSLHHAFIRCSL